MRRGCRLYAAVSLLAMFTCAEKARSESDWTVLQALQPGARVSVLLQDGKYVDGRFEAWSPDAIDVAAKRGVQTIRSDDARRVTVQEKRSRWRGALIGGLIGFGVGFAVGAASAGYIMDRNDPGFSGRAGIGAGIGMFSAGIGAPIGALTGARKQVLIYNVPARVRQTP